MKKLIVLLLIFSIPAYGETNVVPLAKGQSAPFDGFLFTTAFEKQLRLTDEQLKFETDLNTSLKSINLELQEDVGVMQDRITNQQAEIKELSNQHDGFFTKVGYFFLGAGLASLVAYGAARAVR